MLIPLTLSLHLKPKETLKVLNISVEQAKKAISFYLSHKEDLDSIIMFIQNNQESFGSPKAGTPVFKLVLSVLQEYVKWKQS